MASRTRRFYRFFFGTSTEVIQGEQLSQTTFIIVVDSIVRQRADQLGLKLFLHIWTDILCQFVNSCLVKGVIFLLTWRQKKFPI